MGFEENQADWFPMTEDEKKAVWRQVDRLLADSSFSKSKRYPSLLRYIVGRTLDGETEAIKERILGIEVFGRNPGYDSTQDPIVRVTAAELRKRMVRYYQDPAHEHELRLDLHPGSYVPHFKATADEVSPQPSHPQEQVPAPFELLLETPQADPPKPAGLVYASYLRPRRLLLWGLCCCCALTAILIFLHTHQLDAFDAFWHPLLASKRPILICTSDSQSGATLLDAINPVQPGLSQNHRYVSADTLASVVGLVDSLSSRGHQYKVQTQTSTTLSDLGNGPSVLVGTFNNFWTLKFTEGLPFHFANDAAFRELSIEDGQDPSHRKWSIDAFEKNPSVDYTLVVRCKEPATRQWTVIVGGLTAKGNIAALRFLLSREMIADINQAAPKGWQDKNLAFVLRTDVINGNPGSARIEAVHTW